MAEIKCSGGCGLAKNFTDDIATFMCERCKLQVEFDAAISRLSPDYENDEPVRKLRELFKKVNAKK